MATAFPSSRRTPCQAGEAGMPPGLREDSCFRQFSMQAFCASPGTFTGRHGTLRFHCHAFPHGWRETETLLLFCCSCWVFNTLTTIARYDPSSSWKSIGLIQRLQLDRFGKIDRRHPLRLPRPSLGKTQVMDTRFTRLPPTIKGL